MFIFISQKDHNMVKTAEKSNEGMQLVSNQKTSGAVLHISGAVLQSEKKWYVLYVSHFELKIVVFFWKV